MSRSSTKGTARRAIRADLVAKILAARDVCELCPSIAPLVEGWECDGWRGLDVHEPHTRGRGGSALDVTNTLVACRASHEWCHANPRAALDLGAMKKSAADLLKNANPPRRERRRDMARIDAPTEILTFIADYALERGHGPTVAEIVAWCVEEKIETPHLHLGELIDKCRAELDRDSRVVVRELVVVRRIGVGGRFNDSATLEGSRPGEAQRGEVGASRTSAGGIGEDRDKPFDASLSAVSPRLTGDAS